MVYKLYLNEAVDRKQPPVLLPRVLPTPVHTGACTPSLLCGNTPFFPCSPAYKDQLLRLPFKAFHNLAKPLFYATQPKTFTKFLS